MSARQPSTRGSDVLDRIAHSLDPQRQAQRDVEQSSTLFQSQQLILLQSRIRNLNQTIQTLQDQVTDSERRRVDADRRADQLQNLMYITSALRQAQQPPAVTNPPYRESATRAAPTESPPNTPGAPRNQRWEAVYRDGGRCSWFGVGDGAQPDSDDSDVVGVNRIPWSPSPRSPAQFPPPLTQSPNPSKHS